MKMTKKILALTLAVATVVSSAVAPVQKAEAAKSAKITFGIMFAGNGDTCDWLANPTGSDGCKKVAKTVTVKSGKKTTVTLKVGNVNSVGKKVSVKEATVFCIDALNAQKSFKKCKFSNIVVKCDGKKVSGLKFKQGSFESNMIKSKYNWRASMFNKWGRNGDDTAKNGTAKKYKFKKNMTVTFTFVGK